MLKIKVKTGEPPFCDSLGTIHPCCGIKEHAVVVNAGCFIERIGDVQYQRVVGADINWRWPEKKKKKEKEKRKKKKKKKKKKRIEK